MDLDEGVTETLINGRLTDSVWGEVWGQGEGRPHPPTPQTDRLTTVSDGEG